MKTSPPYVLFYLLLGSWWLGTHDVALAQSFWQPASGLDGGLVVRLVHHAGGRMFAVSSHAIHCSTDDGLSWSLIYEGSNNIYIDDFAVNASGHLFAAIPDGEGIVRSSDGGKTWVPINKGLTYIDVNTLVIDAQGNLFAAGRSSHEIYVSRDNGEEWIRTGAILDVVRLAIHPNGDLFAHVFFEGVYRSTDQGRNWTKLSLPSPFNVMAFNSRGHIFAGTYAGLFRSTDRGESWKAINGGFVDPYISALAIDANENIFIGTGQTQTGVYRSTDDGEHWSPINNGPIQDLIFTLDVNSSATVFAGNYDGVSRSTDQGETWNAANNGLSLLVIGSLAIHPSGLLFAGSDDHGIFRSADHGRTWTPTPLGIGLARSFASDSSGDIFAATGGGIFVSTDRGDHWVKTGFGQAAQVVAIHPQGDIFAGTLSSQTFPVIGGSVFRSRDNGQRWFFMREGLPERTDILSLAIDSKGRIFAGTSFGLYRFPENGSAWELTELQWQHVRCLAIESNDHVFVGTYGSGVYRSTDRGNTWKSINNGLPSGMATSVNALAMNPATRDIFAATDGGGVLVLTNDGDNWKSLSNGLPPADILSLTVNAQGFLLAGTRGRSAYLTLASTTSLRDSKQPPASFLLEQNYPNPFFPLGRGTFGNPETVIRYALSRDGPVQIAVYNNLGQRIHTLVEQEQRAGVHEVRWDGRDNNRQRVGSGVYYYQLTINGFAQTQKMIVVQ